MALAVLERTKIGVFVDFSKKEQKKPPLLHQKQPRRDVQPMQHRLAPDEDEHPRDGHHGNAELEGVGLAVHIGVVQQGGGFAVEGQHIAVLDSTALNLQRTY